MEPSPAMASLHWHCYLQVRAASSTGARSRGGAGPTWLFFGVQREMLFGRFWLSDTIRHVPVPGIQNQQLGCANYASCSSYCPGYSVRVLTDLQLAKVGAGSVPQGPAGSLPLPHPAFGSTMTCAELPAVSYHPRPCCQTVAVLRGTDPLSAQVMQPQLSQCPRGLRAPESSQVTQKHRAKNRPQQPAHVPQPPEHRTSEQMRLDHGTAGQSGCQDARFGVPPARLPPPHSRH
ncbi:uncharacterized protein LOC115350042 isoform X1 [Aquila chrysaetos chrysaetos]|uniref:uncharacterized protein LOC115350042 isoform X1 n=1 Tax=Aquila chrysaetos chrysaetos TaxID=223781 RepID=UPI001176FAE9|nr:uncharacterized protein LOC115350042 isoform X1 [Aquila chrysaetos chrysaetos]XP_040984109.1 uncharacterized protein LOC115350042 isoform X1 [Aquila chrysaetos chrysaetos]